MTTTNNRDLFANQAKEYAIYRPQYTSSFLGNIVLKANPELTSLEQISSTKKLEKRAVDVATGTGFVASFLADFYSSVTGIDQSKNQLTNAIKKDNIEYKTGSAYDLGIEKESVDLITIAQAIHWLDTNKFYDECARVLKKNGALAIIGYATPILLDSSLNELFQTYYKFTGPFWECSRALLDTRYADLNLPPFNDIQKIEEPLNKTLPAASFVNYMKTWSAYQVYLEKKDPKSENELELFTKRFYEMVGGEQKLIEVTWPMFAIVSRK